MEDLVLSCLESRVEENRNLYARFLVGPLLKGDALTVATALRRVLLSSIESIGITALYIQGITHEFSTIVGVRESVLEISLNFQAIVLSYDKTFFEKKSFFDNVQIGYLQVQGPKVVYANHLKLPLGVKLVDPTQYIATVSKEGSLVLKFIIGKRNNFLHQNSGPESYFGNTAKDLSITGKLGKKNIVRAKKTCFYKKGSTIKWAARNQSIEKGLREKPTGQSLQKTFFSPRTKLPKEETKQGLVWAPLADTAFNLGVNKANVSSCSYKSLSYPVPRTLLHTYGDTSTNLLTCPYKSTRAQRARMGSRRFVLVRKFVRAGDASTCPYGSTICKGSTKLHITSRTCPYKSTYKASLCTCKGMQSFVEAKKPFVQRFFGQRKQNTLDASVQSCYKHHLTFKICKTNLKNRGLYGIFYLQMVYPHVKLRLNLRKTPPLRTLPVPVPPKGVTKGVTKGVRVKKGNQREGWTFESLYGFTNRKFVRDPSTRLTPSEGLQIGEPYGLSSLGTCKGTYDSHNFVKKLASSENDPTKRFFRNQNPFSRRKNLCFANWPQGENLFLNPPPRKRKKVTLSSSPSRSSYKFLPGGADNFATKTNIGMAHLLKKDKVLLLKKEKGKNENDTDKKRSVFLTSKNHVFKSNICLRNVIPLDLALTPILKVNFVIEVDDEVLYLRQKVRERIILEVWTNGSIHPRQAVHDAALSLTDMFASFRSVYQAKT